MPKEKGKELFRALNVILDAITGLNLRDLEAEAKADRGESSSKAAAESSKGKDKVADPDWENIPFNLVPITPLSSRPRFAQIVRSSSEARRPLVLILPVRLLLLWPFGLLVVAMDVVVVAIDVVGVLVVSLVVPLLVVLLVVPGEAPALARAPAQWQSQQRWH
jgi:hypothetical protein